MGAERRYKRQKDRDVKKMYDKEIKRMSTMTDEQKITHLAHLSSRIKPNQEDLFIKPTDVI